MRMATLMGVFLVGLVGPMGWVRGQVGAGNGATAATTAPISLDEGMKTTAGMVVMASPVQPYGEPVVVMLKVTNNGPGPYFYDSAFGKVAPDAAGLLVDLRDALGRRWEVVASNGQEQGAAVSANAPTRLVIAPKESVEIPVALWAARTLRGSKPDSQAPIWPGNYTVSVNGSGPVPVMVSRDLAAMKPRVDWVAERLLRGDFFARFLASENPHPEIAESLIVDLAQPLPVAEQAAEALEGLDRLPPGAGRGIRQAAEARLAGVTNEPTGDPDKEFYIAVAQAAGKAGDDDALAALAAMARPGLLPGVRAEAVQEMRRFSPAKSFPILRPLLQDTDMDVRMAAAANLAVGKDPAALETLLAGMAMSGPLPTESEFQGLANYLDDPRVQPVLEKAVATGGAGDERVGIARRLLDKLAHPQRLHSPLPTTPGPINLAGGLPGNAEVTVDANPEQPAGDPVIFRVKITNRGDAPYVYSHHPGSDHPSGRSFATLVTPVLGTAQQEMLGNGQKADGGDSETAQVAPGASVLAPVFYGGIVDAKLWYFRADAESEPGVYTIQLLGGKTAPQVQVALTNEAGLRRRRAEEIIAGVRADDAFYVALATRYYNPDVLAALLGDLRAGDAKAERAAAVLADVLRLPVGSGTAVAAAMDEQLKKLGNTANDEALGKFLEKIQAVAVVSGEPEALAALEKIADGMLPVRLRVSAVEAMGSFPNVPASEVLSVPLRDPEAGVREAAATQLTKFRKVVGN